tara:strand:+ start:30139 stop:30627 length:489 start_codon:yes stop_codon:yes gene_type:complete
MTKARTLADFDPSAQVAGGKILQVVTGTFATTVNNNTTSYLTSGGKNGTGASNSVSITPTASDSKILVIVNQEIRMEVAEAVFLQIRRDSAVLVTAETGYVANASATNSYYWGYNHQDTPTIPSTPIAITYSVYHKPTTSNKAASANTNNQPSSITVMEIAA